MSLKKLESQGLIEKVRGIGFRLANMHLALLLFASAPFYIFFKCKKKQYGSAYANG